MAHFWVLVLLGPLLWTFSMWIFKRAGLSKSFRQNWHLWILPAPSKSITISFAEFLDEISSTSTNTSVSSKFNSGEVKWFALLIPARTFDWSWTLKEERKIFIMGVIHNLGTCCFSIWIWIKYYVRTQSVSYLLRCCFKFPAWENLWLQWSHL